MIHISPQEEDRWTWSWEAKGIFSTRSVYQAHYKAKTLCDLAPAIWGTWAPMRCKLAAWLFIRGRVWTADRLAKRGLPHNDLCPFCNVSKEDAQHLFMGCAIVKILWSLMLGWARLQDPSLSHDLTLREWWHKFRTSLPGKKRGRLDSMIILTTWSIWRERNKRIFEKTIKPLNLLIEQLKSEAKLWSVASSGRLTFMDAH